MEIMPTSSRQRRNPMENLKVNSIPEKPGMKPGLLMKNENASLPDAETLTYLKEGYDRIDFQFSGC